MNKGKNFILGLLSVFVSVGTVSAAEITGLKIKPSGSQVFVEWSSLSDFNPSSREGYALQWSEKESDIKNIKPSRFYTKDTVLTLRKRSFDVNTPYYFRVYTYKKIGRSRNLYNGSKVIKWTMKFDDTVVTEEQSATGDVAITDSGATVNNTGASGLYEFSPIRTLALDNFTDIYWSKPRKISKSEYSAYQIIVAKDKDFKEIIKTVKIDQGTHRVRLTGLSSETSYYLKGSFLNAQSEIFGTSSTKSFKTIANIDRNSFSRAARNIKKMEKKNIKKIDINVEASSVSTESISSSDSEDNKEEKKTEKKKKTPKKLTKKNDIQKRITAIKKELRSLQQELRSLLRDLRNLR